MPEIRLTVSTDVYELLDVLADPTEGLASVEVVVMALIDHAQQGVYRPGAWERGWLEQAFGTRWQQKLEPQPDAPMFDRVKAAPS